MKTAPRPRFAQRPPSRSQRLAPSNLSSRPSAATAQQPASPRPQRSRPARGNRTVHSSAAAASQVPPSRPPFSSSSSGGDREPLVEMALSQPTDADAPDSSADRPTTLLDLQPELFPACGQLRVPQRGGWQPEAYVHSHSAVPCRLLDHQLPTEPRARPRSAVEAAPAGGRCAAHPLGAGKCCPADSGDRQLGSSPAACHGRGGRRGHRHPRLQAISHTASNSSRRRAAVRGAASPAARVPLEHVSCTDSRSRGPH